MPPRFIVRKAARSAEQAVYNSLNVQKFEQRVIELKSLGVEVGVPAGVDQDGTSLALIAAANNYGAVISVNRAGPGSLAAPATADVIVIPERPFMKVGINQGRPLFSRLNKVNLGRVLRGEMTPTVAIGQLGAAAVGSIQRVIKTYAFTPNAPSTIQAKGSSHPLIDIGRLWQSITFQVKRP